MPGLPRLLPSLVILLLAGLAAPRADALELSGQRNIHDPSRILELDGRYYTYGTGFAGSPIVTRYSDDLVNWSNGPAPFSSVPPWALDLVPNNGNTNMWAPDVIQVGGEYWMYYSVSSFGSQRSVIGLATNTTLDFNDPSYQWIDQGLVISSQPGDPYNAIDAGLLYEEETNSLWFSFGSYWSGTHVTQLNPTTGKLSPRSPAPINIARNTGSPANAIEASYLMEHDGWYYLVVNWDACCQGVDSTYNLRVGRSDSPTGPFLDRDGVDMRFGGGDLFLATEGTQIGPGHFSDFSADGLNYFSFHYYDGASGGVARLGIEEFGWTFDGWPVAMRDLPAGDYNRDGVVDAADYTVWRDTLGSTTDLRADGSSARGSAGRIDASDYGVWKLNFGVVYTTPGSTPIAAPEPSAGFLAALAVVGLIQQRTRSGNHDGHDGQRLGPTNPRGLFVVI